MNSCEPSNQVYRESFRKQHIGPYYNGYLHFAFTLLVCITLTGYCIISTTNVQTLEWITVPFTFVYANLAEYFGHKGPMHHPKPFLGIIFERHTRQHHIFFTHDHMAFDSSKDFKAVLFPPVMIVFFAGVFAAPVGFVLSWLFSSNVGLLFVATGIAYFLNYEIFHFIYHLPESSPVLQIPGVKKLRQLHLDHHRTDWMSHYNFNITYPIGDWLFGTLKRDQSV